MEIGNIAETLIREAIQDGSLKPPAVRVIANGEPSYDVSPVLLMHPDLMASMVESSHDDGFVSSDWLDMFARDEWAYGMDGLFEEAIQDGLLSDKAFHSIDETSLDEFIRWYRNATHDAEFPYLCDSIDDAIGQTRHASIILSIIQGLRDRQASVSDMSEARYKYSTYRQVRDTGLGSVSGEVFRNVLNRYHVHDGEETSWLCAMVQWCYMRLMEDDTFNLANEVEDIARHRHQSGDNPQT